MAALEAEATRLILLQACDQEDREGHTPPPSAVDRLLTVLQPKSGSTIMHAVACVALIFVRDEHQARATWLDAPTPPFQEALVAVLAAVATRTSE